MTPDDIDNFHADTGSEEGRHPTSGTYVIECFQHVFHLSIIFRTASNPMKGKANCSLVLEDGYDHIENTVNSSCPADYYKVHCFLVMATKHFANLLDLFNYS